MRSRPELCTLALVIATIAVIIVFEATQHNQSVLAKYVPKYRKSGTYISGVASYQSRELRAAVEHTTMLTPSPNKVTNESLKVTPLEAVKLTKSKRSTSLSANNLKESSYKTTKSRDTSNFNNVTDKSVMSRFKHITKGLNNSVTTPSSVKTNTAPS